MVLFIVVASAIILLAAYFTYGKFLANTVFKLDDKNPVPSVEMEDGVDYVPAKKGMLLGQHFSAIAAAGPINGPILAAVIYGWAPALLWVILGCIFIGGIHDMGSLVASVRHKAKSITEVVRLNVSQRAWILFMIFVWITLVYVIVAFTDITASSFVGNVTLENGEVVSGAGIASSSAMYLALPIIMGLLMRFGGLKEGLAVAIFLPLVGVAIWAGQSACCRSVNCPENLGRFNSGLLPCCGNDADVASAAAPRRAWRLFPLHCPRCSGNRHYVWRLRN